jgi:hypothetical protein
LDQKYQWDYEACLKWEGYLDKDWNRTAKFCGWRNSDSKEFYDIDRGFSIWCEDGSSFNGFSKGRNHIRRDDKNGFSVRCIQG